MSMTAPAYYVRGMAKQALENIKSARVRLVYSYLKESQKEHSYMPGYIGKLLGFKPRECSFQEALAIETSNPNNLSLERAIHRAYFGLPSIMDLWCKDETRFSKLLNTAELASRGANGPQTKMAISVDDADLLTLWLSKQELDIINYWV